MFSDLAVGNKGTEKCTAPCHQPLCRIVTPVGMLGYGFDEAEVNHGLELSLEDDVPTAIILDSGSTDSGPMKLALGTMTCPRASYENDLRRLIKAVRKYRVPLLISSAGGSGTDAHVKEFLDIIGEILNSPGDEGPAKLKVIGIYSNLNRDIVVEKLEAGRISGCGPCVPPLTRQDLEATPTIVAQIGPEPFLQAMTTHPDFDIIIGGRAYDPVPYVAFCAFHAFDKVYHPVTSIDKHTLGGFTHMGKIMECGGLCATPKSKSSLATIYQDGTFDVRPLAPGSICTPMTVAAHTLYEKSRPDRLYGPGGYLDLSSATYLPLSDQLSTRVQGAVFMSCRELGESYTVKLEGATVTGYRTIFMGSFGDPILISQLSTLLAAVREYVQKQFEHVDEKWELGFHVYGLGEGGNSNAGEVFIVGEAHAETQVLATSIASTARIACVHGPYKGQKATSGNFGMGIGGKLEIETGLCAEFSLYHLMELENGQEEAVEIGTKAGQDERNEPQKLFTWEVSWLGNGDRIQVRQGEGKGAQQPLPLLLTTLDEEGFSAPPAPVAISGTLGDIAKIIRSKNAGPYEVTFDVIFGSPIVYHQVKESGTLRPELIAQLYKIPITDIVYCGFFDQALAFKATIPRLRDGKAAASGGFMENDVHGSQQYRPLLDVKLQLDI